MTELIMKNFRYDLEVYGDYFILEMRYHEGLEMAKLNGFWETSNRHATEMLVDRPLFVVSYGYVMMFFSKKPQIVVSPGHTPDRGTEFSGQR